MLLCEIAEHIGGRVVGIESPEITGISSIDEATPGDLVFAESDRYLQAALRSKAAAILCMESNLPGSTEKSLVLVENPRAAFSKALALFQEPVALPVGIHATAVLGQNVAVGEGIRIGAHVTVGDRTVLGEGVTLMEGARIGAGVEIGEQTIVHPNAVVYPNVRIGKRCVLFAGCIVGGEGYGYVPVGNSLQRVPHIGTVRIGDDVEIGANTCIDRAKTGETTIGSGTKIDNLVHIAHNVHIGQSCLVIAQVGIAGSVDIGNGVILAGQVGIKDHIVIGDGARIAAQSGIMNNVPPGQAMFGYPARPHGDMMREIAARALLPEYIKRIRNMEKRIASLEARLIASPVAGSAPEAPTTEGDS